MTDSTMVLRGRLTKTLTVQWFLEVIWRSFENMADTPMVLGGRSKKFTARTMVSRGCKARFSNDLPKPLSCLSFFGTTSKNHGIVSQVFKRPPNDLPKPMLLSAFLSNDIPKPLYCQLFSQSDLTKPLSWLQFFKRDAPKRLYCHLFLKIALKEGFRKPWYCQHFSEGTFKNNGTVSIF